MKRKQSYTLIEIMVVMALAAILTAMALPAFSALINGNSVATTCGIVKNTLDLAQAKAINDRRYVATVIDATAAGKVSGLHDTSNKLSCQALRNCYVIKNGDNDYTFDKWLDGSNWVKLDQNAQILTIASGGVGSTPNFPTDSSVTLNGLQTIKNAKDQGTESIPGVVYSPYGDVKLANSFYIGIGEATLTGGNYIYKSTKSDSKATANGMAVTVNRFTGRSLVATLDKDGKIEE